MVIYGCINVVSLGHNHKVLHVCACVDFSLISDRKSSPEIDVNARGGSFCFCLLTAVTLECFESRFARACLESYLEVSETDGD